MVKRILNPLIVSVFILTMVLSSLAHLMYGRCQTSKWHYLVQAWYMPEYFPKWMIVKKTPIVDEWAQVGELEIPLRYTGIWNTWYENGTIRSMRNYVKGKRILGQA